jgi:microcystin-dependent protein
MEVFLGTILPFGFNFAPTGWAMCNGQILAIQQNAALFSLPGTYYGGNGVSTFGLPNLQGRLPMHMGNGLGLSPRVIGEIGGTENVSLLQSNMPAHSHVLNASTTTAPAPGSSPANSYLAATTGADNQGNPVTVQIYGPTANTTMNANSIGPSGSSVPFPIMPPFLVVNFCIALNGIFPSRN